jgi:methylmalonyl-CoA mutase
MPFIFWVFVMDLNQIAFVVIVRICCTLHSRSQGPPQPRRLIFARQNRKSCKKPPPYVPKHKIRIVTAASLFDGHDAAINIMRRIIQSTGVEVIHLGHDRSVEDVVNTAIQEDAHAIAMTSYQGGHTEYFKYMHDLLKEKGRGAHQDLSVVVAAPSCPSEIKELQGYGITRIYHPDDGRAMGLQGMINDMLEKADFDLGDKMPRSM